MKNFATLVFATAALCAPALAQDLPSSVVPGTAQFDEKVLVSGLQGPWEITWGRDNFLWVTERTAGKIDRIDPQTGAVKTAIKLPEVFAPGGQDGLLGLALDPDLLQGKGHDYVYTAYTYVDKARGADETVVDPNSPYRYLYTNGVRYENRIEEPLLSSALNKALQPG